MGNTIKQCGKCWGKDESIKGLKSPIVQNKDKSKIKNFKDKCKKLTSANTKLSGNKLDIIHDAMKDLNITPEPVETYYIFGEVIGAGKYGVVKKWTSGNQEFS